jgi:hypothetical protein
MCCQPGSESKQPRALIDDELLLVEDELPETEGELLEEDDELTHPQTALHCEMSSYTATIS